MEKQGGLFAKWEEIVHEMVLYSLVTSLCHWYQRRARGLSCAQKLYYHVLAQGHLTCTKTKYYIYFYASYIHPSMSHIFSALHHPPPTCKRVSESPPQNPEYSPSLLQNPKTTSQTLRVIRTRIRAHIHAQAVAPVHPTPPH
jgi:hypothetical protein